MNAKLMPAIAVGACLTVTMGASLTSLPAAAAEGLYVALGAGPDLEPDTDVNIAQTSDGTHNFPTVSKWETGWAVVAAGGYKWDFGLRTEVEYSYREQKIKSFGANPWYGSQWDNSLMVNVLYDIPTGTDFTPFIGGGLGGTHLSWGDNFRPAGTIVTYDASELKLGWQAIVGAAYAISPRADITLDFRIKGSTEDYSFPANIPGIVANRFDYLTHTIVIGFRYALGD